MRVALITDGIWPYVLGGMQKHSYYLCKYLAQNHVYVDLVHFNRSTYNISKLEFFTEKEKDYIQSIIVDFPTGPGYPGAYMLRSYLHSQLIYKALQPKLPTYDFIYTKGFTGWHLINQKFKGKLTCAPVGVKFHGYEMFQKPPSFKIWLQQVLLLRAPVKQLSKRADVVFSYGGKITEIIYALNVNKSKVVEMASGVEESTLATNITPVSGKIKFLFLGRYERRKGIEELNVAIGLLAKENKLNNLEFHFIGPIPKEKQLSLSGVIYHGEIRDKQRLSALVSTCDVLLCPSWSEGMPNSILEAMASGLAVLATDVGAVNLLVTPATGWLINYADAALIKTALDGIISEGWPAINLKKQAALNHIRQQFTWEKLIQKFIQQITPNKQK